VGESLTIPKQFNGPLDSGNGGYSSGAIAGFLGGPAEVTLRRPVPLDRELAVESEADGAVRVLDGQELIAEARFAADIDLDVPAAPTVDEARVAASRYRGLADGMFSRCFVCGRARDDAFGVFAGEVEGRDLAASPWTPPAWTADPEGNVLPEFVWAVLDCPTYFALYMRGELPLSVLARLTAKVAAPVPAGEEQVVIAWPVAVEGRKRHAGSAVVSADGEVLASARALLIEPRES
jgi:hypothetical protein